MVMRRLLFQLSTLCSVDRCVHTAQGFGEYLGRRGHHVEADVPRHVILTDVEAKGAAVVPGQKRGLR